MTDPEADDREKRLTRARESYAEVLDATKHQDDKINRVLVGIAFLTTGAIALFFKPDIAGARWYLGGRQYPLVALTTGAYVACTLVAVVLLLLSLSSELRLPGGEPGGAPNDLEGSYLYFTFIANRTRLAWTESWNRPVKDLEQDLLKQYIKETHNLAQRARVKYGRTDEAAAMFVLALMFLAIGFLLSLEVVTRTATGPLGFGWVAAGIVGGVFAVHTFLQLYIVYRSEQQETAKLWQMMRRAGREARRLRWRMRGTRVLMVSVPGYALLVVSLAVVRSTPWRWAIAVFAAMLVLLTLAACAPRWNEDRYRTFLSRRLLSRYALPYTVSCLVLLVLAVLPAVAYLPWLAVPAGAIVPMVLAALTIGRQVSAARRVVREIVGATEDSVGKVLGPLRQSEYGPSKEDDG